MGSQGTCRVLSQSGKVSTFLFFFSPLVGRQGYPGVTVSENCIKLTAGRGREQLSYAGSSMQNATRSQEPASMRTSCTWEAGKLNGEGIVAAARTRKRKASIHQLRDFPPVVNHHGERRLPRPIAACILEATVHLGGSIRETLGILQSPLIRRTAHSQPDRPQPS